MSVPEFYLPDAFGWISLLFAIVLEIFWVNCYAIYAEKCFKLFWKRPLQESGKKFLFPRQT